MMAGETKGKAMELRFTIVRDHLYEQWEREGRIRPDDKSEAGTHWGPRGSERYEIDESIDGARRFRLYDDDRELYYSGWFVGEWEDLLDWGMYYAGCTYVTDGDGEIICG